VFANLIFNNSEDFTGAALWLGALFFAFQIYGDFSGYSDIAIGTARLFGFNLMRNFAFPYFSRDIAEFWRRWHISLSTWFRDYLYIPLGGSKGSTWKKIRNTFIIFVVSGFWHGANWTFLVWGALNAIYFLPLLLTKKNRQNLEMVAQGKLHPSLKEIFQIGFTFALTLVAWVFFRASNIKHAFLYSKEMFIGLFDKIGYVDILNLFYWEIGLILPVLLGMFFILEWTGRENQYAIKYLFFRKPRFQRWSFYYLIFALILLFGGKEQTFIYFQF
jgi:D-alanyl-lipoteichoic acid acyltransferase DltB (MBOAT superfamily)